MANVTTDTTKWPTEVRDGKHKAFSLKVMRPEIEETGDFKKAVNAIQAYFEAAFRLQEEGRSVYESKWLVAEDHYEQAERLQYEHNRQQSILKQTGYMPPSKQEEDDAARAAYCLPDSFESTQHWTARLQDSMFGPGPDYAEIVGREKGDVDEAALNEMVINTQQSLNRPSLNKTFYLFARSSCIRGLGILMHEWDFRRDCRRTVVMSPWDVWFDPAFPTIEEGRHITVFRRVSLDYLERQKAAGRFWFEDAAVRDMSMQRTSHARTGYPQPGSNPITGILESQQAQGGLLDLHIFMQRERWTYVLNKSLVIAVVQNPLPPDELGERDFPVYALSPFPEESTVHGDSIVWRSSKLEDVRNSVVYLMLRNLRNNAEGLWFGDPSKFTDLSGGDPIKPGILNGINGASREAIVSIPQPQIVAECLQLLGASKSWHEQITGVNDTLRGQPTFSGQTATATQTLLAQGGLRLRSAELLGMDVMRRYYSHAMLYNQAYLKAMDVFRITGNLGSWEERHPEANGKISSVHLQGVPSTDIYPTGFSGAGHKQFLATQGVNLAAAIHGMQIGADVRPLLKEALKAAGVEIAETVVNPGHSTMGSDPKQENDAMLAGEEVPVRQEDDHENHLAIHSIVLQIPEVAQYLQENQGVAMRLQGHLQTHADVLSAQQAPQGGPGGTSGMNTAMNPPRPDEKQPRELEAQMAQRGA